MSATALLSVSPRGRKVPQRKTSLQAGFSQTVAVQFRTFHGEVVYITVSECPRESNEGTPILDFVRIWLDNDYSKVIFDLNGVKLPQETVAALRASGVEIML